MPIFGICLGHQLLALAIDAQTTKLKYGHRGVNHPVKDIDEDRTYITSQNHGYAVVGESVDPKIARVRYVNLNDGTVEGLEHIGRPVFTVQYHPEVCPVRWTPRICLINSSKTSKSRKEALSNAASQGYS